MRFTIVKNTGINQPLQLSYDFSPPGGTIGCCEGNNWVLPDEEQKIARLQAIVSLSVEGECRITNRGSASAILLNTLPLAPDRQVEIRHGDILSIGSYQIQAMDVSKSSPPQASSRMINTEQQADTVQSDIPNSVWDELEQVLISTNMSPTPDKQQAISAESISAEKRAEENDNNPLFRQPAQENNERNPIDPLTKIKAITSLEALQQQAIDPLTMFDSDSFFQQDNILNDPTPTTLFPPDDPLDLMLGNAVPLTAPENPTISEDPFASALPPLFATEILSKVLSQNLANSHTQTDTIKSRPKADSEAIPETIPKNMDAKKPQSASFINNNDVNGRLDIDPINYAHSEYQNSENTHSDCSQTEECMLEGKLLTSLLAGMKLQGLYYPRFDQQRMYQLGQLVSQLSQGIVALNASRTLLKRDADAAMTQMRLDANNPFKLLPSGQSVLVQMFGEHMPGFMPAEQATRDILIELQAHQLGMIAGVRAITADILQLFHPAILEQKARDERGMPRLSLSSTYKAALWEFLTQYHQKVISEFEQNAVLFGENFLQSYENEVNKYKESHNQSKQK
ncbi:MAG: FHA domain-containing protein [Enterobacteriaceae bacterium]|jgi:FHA domain-containing protein|nr:FHA domain-containing protein [Enterobacteriaceae bacterium]